MARLNIEPITADAVADSHKEVEGGEEVNYTAELARMLHMTDVDIAISPRSAKALSAFDPPRDFHQQFDGPYTYAEIISIIERTVRVITAPAHTEYTIQDKAARATAIVRMLPHAFAKYVEVISTDCVSQASWARFIWPQFIAGFITAMEESLDGKCLVWREEYYERINEGAATFSVFSHPTLRETKGMLVCFALLELGNHFVRPLADPHDPLHDAAYRACGWLISMTMDTIANGAECTTLVAAIDRIAHFIKVVLKRVVTGQIDVDFLSDIQSLCPLDTLTELHKLLSEA
jgi:hypothetical protein